ncbi:MAG TPA: ABC transporter permease subunit, partial [Chthonomonadales bacterium]|nr:ABC transporter permease subunit [Chthonomonadales bacterium]
PMRVLTIAGLTLKEAARRRTFLGVLVLGLLVLGLSLVLVLMRKSMEHNVAIGRWDFQRYAIEYPIAESFITTLCMSLVKALSALVAMALAGAAISAEIEAGVLAVILPKPIRRWEILLGKWIGINLVLVVSVLLWIFIVWLSLTEQTHRNLDSILRAGVIMTLYPVLVSTLALTLSTFVQRVFGTSIAFAITSIAWFDGILNSISHEVRSAVVARIAVAAGLTLPQGYVGWWVESQLGDLAMRDPGRRAPWSSPRYLNTLGLSHLHTSHLDIVYVAAYIVTLFFIGAVVFHYRDV